MSLLNCTELTVQAGGPDEEAGCGRGGGAPVGRIPRFPLLWDISAERRGHQRDVSGECRHTHAPLKSNIVIIVVLRFLLQSFFSSITDMCENGGKRPVAEVSVGFTKEQADTIRRIRNSKDSWDMLGVKPGATRWVGSTLLRLKVIVC